MERSFDNHSSKRMCDIDIPPGQLKEFRHFTPELADESDLTKKLWDLVKHKSQAKDIWEQAAFDMEEIKLEYDLVRSKFETYKKEVDESEGFDVGDYGVKLLGWTQMTVPMKCSKDELGRRFNRHAESAITLYNMAMDAKFKFVEIEKANWRPPSTYLITFTTSDENDDPKVFQAALVNPIRGDPIVSLCRQKGNHLEEGYMNHNFID